jgi:hypothetical protein
LVTASSPAATRLLGRGLLAELAGRIDLILTSTPYGSSLHEQVETGESKSVDAGSLPRLQTVK